MDLTQRRNDSHSLLARTILARLGAVSVWKEASGAMRIREGAVTMDRGAKVIVSKSEAMSCPNGEGGGS